MTLIKWEFQDFVSYVKMHLQELGRTMGEEIHWSASVKTH